MCCYGHNLLPVTILFRDNSTSPSTRSSKSNLQPFARTNNRLLSVRLSELGTVSISQLSFLDVFMKNCD